MGFFRDVAEEVGKWIPNEISKTNSYSKYTQYIPVVGPFLSGAQRGLSTVDNAATAYGDGSDFGTALRGAQLGASGTAASPGDYRAGFYNTSGRNFFDVAGQVGNYLPGFSTGSNGNVNGFDFSGMFKGGGVGFGNQLSSLVNNPTLFGSGETPVRTNQAPWSGYQQHPVRTPQPQFQPQPKPAAQQFSLFQVPGQFKQQGFR